MRRRPMMWIVGAGAVAAVLCVAAVWWHQRRIPSSDRAEEVRRRVMPRLQAELAPRGLQPGRPVFIRIFKESKELELWMQPEADARFQLARAYPVATYGSGRLGPKLAEGDLQAPEGVYEVGAEQLNPRSSYHLAFNIGYPNAYDRAHGRTGSFIMVHGSRSSIGCFAMTDPFIEEIYLLVEEALRQGQGRFAVHIFPFRMTEQRMAAARGDRWHAFWEQLQPIYEAFEASGRPPRVAVEGGAYRLAP